jgi:AcrR family transcriptional regulator
LTVSSTSSVGRAASRAIGVHYDGDLRADLIAAAADAIAASGPDGLSLRAVARMLGVSHAAPAHHFGDRVGLLTAVAAVGFERFVQQLAEAVIAAPPDPAEVVYAMGRAYADFAERDSGYFDVMFSPRLVDADDPAYVEASDAAFEALLDVVEDCQRAGFRSEADPRSLAVALWSLAHGLAVLRRHGSLGRHYPDSSLDAIPLIAATLLPVSR